MSTDSLVNPCILEDKTNLLGLPRADLAVFFERLGEKPYRAQQLMKWLYQRGVVDFALMTDFSKKLREKLSRQARVCLPSVRYHHVSADGTQKWLLDMGGPKKHSAIEMVFIPESGRGTLCVSSQIGCALDCDFCATGKQGFARDLSASEIIAQVFIAQAAFGPLADIPGKKPISNVVMMGMGEPLLNFDQLVPALQIMLDDCGYGISKRRLTVSTSGVVPKMDALSQVVDVSLAISMHAPDNALRDRLVPLNKKYPLDVLMAACWRYAETLGARARITIEYVMLQGVNDSPDQARALVKLLGDLPCKVNLIPFNPFPHAGYQRSSAARIERFQKVLFHSGLITTVRKTRGDDIDAACGQLVGEVEDRTRRQQAWQALIIRQAQGEDAVSVA